MEANNRTGAQLQAMSLIATLRAAAEVAHALAERRAGRDPSEQEAEAPARAYLLAASSDLRTVVNRLRMALAVERDPEAALVQAFEDRMLLARAARELHLVHQRLLSLYPAVEGRLAEDARRMQAEAARLVATDEEHFAPALEAWTEAASAFLEALAKAVFAAN
jgi:hypothetical protein